MATMNNKINLIANLLEQIRQLDDLLILHNNDEDTFMLNQYQAKKNEFLKLLFDLEMLVSEKQSI